MRTFTVVGIVFLVTGCGWTNTNLLKAPPPRTPAQQQAAAEDDARQRAVWGQVLRDVADVQRDASYRRDAIYQRPAVIVVPAAPPPRPRPVQVQCVDLGAGVVQCQGN